MGFIFNYIMDNAFEVDAKAQEEKLREKEPNLLDPRETIEFAFKEARDTRDKSYFTSHRILIKDGKGIGKKRRNFKSIPYECVQDFSITTAGAIDDDIEVIIKTTGSFTHDITIAKKQCDIYALQQYLAARVTQFYQAEGSQEEIIPVNVANAGDAGTFLSFFNNDASSFSPSEVENKFKTDTPVLLQNESVEMAFKTGRDFFIFTSLRLFIVDVQGLTGKQIQFQSIAWSALSSITIETAGGAFDRDTELILHTSMPGKDIIEIEFRKSQVSVFQVARSLANKLLGPDLEPLEEVEANKTGVMATVSGWFNRADNKPLEADEVNIMLHEHFPLLQGSEKVELAFGARGDMLVFTTKRLVIVDPTGRLRRKGRTEYTSIPYKNIVAFAVETASGMMDNDTELMIWTDMNFIPPEIKDGEQVEPPQPGMSFMEFDFNKKLVDIIGLKKYLGDRVLKSQKVEAAPMKPDIGMGSNESTMGNFFSNFGDNQRPIDPIEVNESLHSQTPLLLDDEVVIMAFRAGRDLSVFSNYRVIVIDVQGWTGRKVSYKSLSYKGIRAFSVESAGAWDRDTQLDLLTSNLWNLKHMEMDFRKGVVDILAVQNFVAAMVIGNSDDQAKYLNNPGADDSANTGMGISGFTSWLSGDAVEQDTAAVDAQLHNETPILLANEKCQKAYKTGRDLYVYTTHRVIIVDVQGIMGKRVEYSSIPLKWLHAYEVETAGHMDNDAEVYLYMDVPQKEKIEHSILVKKADIMELQLHLTKAVLFKE